MGKSIEKYKRKQQKLNRKLNRIDRNSRQIPIQKGPASGAIAEGSTGGAPCVAQPSSSSPDNQAKERNAKRK